MPPYTYLDLAAESLLLLNGKATVERIWDRAVQAGLAAKLRSQGQTPWATLGARLYVDVKENPASLFVREPGRRPAEFSLRNPATARAQLAAQAKTEVLPEQESPTELPLLPTPIPMNTISAQQLRRWPIGPVNGHNPKYLLCLRPISKLKTIPTAS